MAFERFMRSVRETPRIREEYESFDIPALQALGGEERDLAKQAVLDLLADPTCGDLRVVDALTVLGDPDVVPPLEAALERCKRSTYLSMVTAIGRALHQLKPAYDPSDDFQFVIDYEGYFEGKVGAIVQLHEIDPGRAVPAALQVMKELLDPFAKQTLLDLVLRSLGQGMGRADEPSRLGAIQLRLRSPAHAVAQAGAERLARLFALVKESGEGILSQYTAPPATASEVEAALGAVREGRPADPDLLGRLDDIGRDYVEAAWLAQLPSDNAWVYEALAALRSKEAVAALEELLGNRLTRPYGPVLDAAKRGLSQIKKAVRG